MIPMDRGARVARFWEKYTEKSKCYGIKPKNIRWYVRHVELYIKAHKAPIKTHTAEILDQYFQLKGRSARLKDWQFCQAVDALRILFVDLLTLPSASDVPWDDLKSQSRTLPGPHPSE